MVGLVWLLLVGCWSPSAPVSAEAVGQTVAVEAYDVPGPPGQRTVEISGLVGPVLALGALVEIREGERVLAVGDVVDAGPGVATIYVAAGAADGVIGAAGPLVVVGR